MRTEFAAILFAGAAVCGASAGNVIREWGQQHVQGEEYYIRSRPHYGDYAVEIIANTHPESPWKFEAYDSVTLQEGDIDSITIVSAEPVGGIDLRIEPAPGSGRSYGAANVKQIDLVTNGSAANRLTMLSLRGDYGGATQAGTLRAGKAGDILIGGNVVAPTGVDAIDVTGWVSGSVEIGGDILSPVNLPLISGQCTIHGGVAAAVTLHRVRGTLTERSFS